MRPSTPPEESEWIEAYLNQQLSAAERKEFETELAHDEALRAEVEMRRLIHSVLDDANLQTAIAAVHAEKKKEEELLLAQLLEEARAATPVVPLRSTTLVRQLWWKRAASLAAAAGGLWFGYLSFAPITPANEAGHATRSPVEWDSAPPQPSSFCYDNYYAGRDFLTTQQPARAIPCLEHVAACEVRPYFKDASKWFLTVACLQAGQTDRADQLLHEIDQSPDFKYPIDRLDRWKLNWQLLLARLSQ